MLLMTPEQCPARQLLLLAEMLSGLPRESVSDASARTAKALAADEALAMNIPDESVNIPVNIPVDIPDVKDRCEK